MLPRYASQAKGGPTRGKKLTTCWKKIPPFELFLGIPIAWLEEEEGRLWWMSRREEPGTKKRRLSAHRVSPSLHPSLKFGIWRILLQKCSSTLNPNQMCPYLIISFSFRIKTILKVLSSNFCSRESPPLVYVPNHRCQLALWTAAKGILRSVQYRPFEL